MSVAFSSEYVASSKRRAQFVRVCLFALLRESASERICPPRVPAMCVEQAGARACQSVRVCVARARGGHIQRATPRVTSQQSCKKRYDLVHGSSTTS